MFKQYLQRPLAFLCIAVIVIRVSLDQLLLLKPDAGSWFDLLTAAFVLAIPITEAVIIYHAYKAYSGSPPPIAIHRSGIAGKILLPLFFLCLPIGLWGSRRSEVMATIPYGRWIGIAGLAAGCGFNLILSGSIVHSMLATHSRSKQVA